MQLAAKIRKDFLKVDRFWRTFLTNHSKYNPLPLDQLKPIESPAPSVDNNSYLKHNQIVPPNHNHIGVQTLEPTDFNEKSNSTTGGIHFHELNGTISELAIEEVKIESYDVYESVKCEFDDDVDSNDYPNDSIGDDMEEDTKDPTGDVDDQSVNSEDILKRRSGRKYPKNRNIHGTDPIRGEEQLFKCLQNECNEGN